MVRLTKIRRKSQEYYILAYNIRKGRKVIRKEKYIGKEVPENIDELKDEFSHDIFIEIYGVDLENIQQQYKNLQEKITITEIKKLDEDFGIRFTYDSNKIEGGSLTRNEIKVLILHDQSPQRPLTDILETKAHYKLIQYLRDHKKDLSLETVLEWHYMIFKDTHKEIAGQIRDRMVKISGSDLIPSSPVELQLLLDELFEWYEEKRQYLHPVELAMLMHYKFVKIHPFIDGNGRISRLLMNFILHWHKYPMYNIRNQERKNYYRVLSRADKKDSPYIVANYLTRKYIKVLKNY